MSTIQVTTRRAPGDDKLSTVESASVRVNNQRAVQTRQVVLNAVIAILYQRGFAALTNMLVFEKTGLSSGTVLHHFPTRQHLLSATIDYAYAELSRFREQELAKLEPGLPRFRALIDMAWHTAQMPAGFAVNEVRIGARSDTNLANVFRSGFTRVALEHGRAMSRLAREAGLKPDEMLQGLWTATSMTTRSLAIDAKTNAGKDIANNALLTLRSTREQIIAAQLGEAARQDPRIAWKPARASKRIAR